MNEALETLRGVAERLTQPLWDQMRTSVLPGLTRSGSFSLDLQAEDLVEWIATQIDFRLVTGSHDPQAVPPIEVGSGLQSLIDLAVLRTEHGDADVVDVLAIEEPEAFLHPSAQRRLARELLSPEQPAQLVVSTHSPIFVDEAEYGAVVLVRDHTIFHPAELPDDRRQAINTALLAGQGSEAIFSRSVLLVEGDGDKAFFEALRRRIVSHDDSGRLDELAIVSVGSNSSFAPWIQLIESYRDSSTGERPITWLIVADGADAGTEVRRAFRDADVKLPAEAERLLGRAAQAQGNDDQDTRIESVRTFNAEAESSGVPICLLPIDLEWCMLQSLGPTTVRRLAQACQTEAGDRAALLRRLGSKYGLGPAADHRKDPWMRAAIGREIPRRELSGDARNVLRRWILGAWSDADAVDALLRKAFGSAG